ncbi:MAG: hypothetical protein HOM52_18730 [Rhodospirillaceae bacterium]|nr:hypothetical protein [Rhodospirillaceae bacterium]
MFKIAGRIAIALALALTIYLGPSQINAAAPDLNGATEAAQHHRDSPANAGHHSPVAAHDQSDADSVKVYCSASTPGHTNHADHGDELCEGSRVLSSALAGAGFDMARYYVLLGAESFFSNLPPGYSPESLKQPPRTA